MKADVYHQYARELSDDHWWVAHRRQLFEDWLFTEGVTPDASKSVLELGSGVGTECSFLQRYGKVTGIELSRDGLRYCENRGYAELISGDINTHDFGVEAYDVVVDFHVLYHTWVSDPGDVLSRLYAALRPGGYLLLTEPAFEGLKRSHDHAVMAARRWTQSELTRLVRRAGFSVRRASGILLPAVPVAFMSAFLDRRRGPSNTIDELGKRSSVTEYLLRGILWGERQALRQVSFPVGTCWAFLARKLPASRSASL